MTKEILPSLKSASGAGFTYEDKVAGLMLCEMLLGRQSLGRRFGVIEKLERQAVDWEPFGDLRLTVPNAAGKLVKCGGSVKSNRPINSNGCGDDLREALWTTLHKPVFTQGEDALALFCAPLSQDVHQHLHSLCNQAAEIDAARLNEKVVHVETRKIYDSFRNPNDKSDAGLPGHILSCFIPREFDFEDTTSQAEAEAIRLCQEVVSPGTAADNVAARLWEDILKIAQTLRTTGGEITREKLVAKLRSNFTLLDDPNDTAAWAHIHNLSASWLNEIDVALPGGLKLPRANELQKLQANLAKGRALPVLGDTGSGKSAALKVMGAELEEKGAEFVWVKSERFDELLKKVPTFVDVCRRTRKSAGFLVFDALEACYDVKAYKQIARVINELTAGAVTPWQVVLICQTPEWPRVTLNLAKYVTSSSLLARHFEFKELSKEDFSMVCEANPSVARLSRQRHLRRVLSMPKMLDVLLSGQIAESLVLASEADLIDWWWEQQVRGIKAITAEERVVRQLAARMADELCTELPPDAVTGSETATNELVRNRVLRMTQDGRIRFHHDLLADWSRVRHLLSLGKDVMVFIRAHVENPPWLRAIRILSQYLLDRAADLDRWRTILNECNTVAAGAEKPSAENLQVLDAWLDGIAFCSSVEEATNNLKPDLFNKNGYLLRRLVRRLLHVGTFPDPVIQDQWREKDPKTAEAAATVIRLPQRSLWIPVLQFLVNNADEAIEYLPEELAEIGIMWARLESHLENSWPVLADLVLRNAEREFYREVGGIYRSDESARVRSGWKDSRIEIYSAGLHAGSQLPDRAIKLVLKAAGRLPWDKGDLPDKTNVEWIGQIQESPSLLFSQPRYTGPLPTSWEQGPRRRTSDDFGRAWLESGAAAAIFKKFPEQACEATMAFLLRWPKFQMSHGAYQDHGSENHGFDPSTADHVGPPFWTKGPFLGFLQANWQAALNLIVQLINFATDRYCDWWPYEPVSQLKFATPSGEVCWRGNRQVYSWNRYNMNVVEIVSCALMALEKWLDDCVNKKHPIAEAIQVIFKQGNSFAFAGVLIALGKRHPMLFLSDLTPLLSLRDIYMLDLAALQDSGVGDFWSQDPKMIKELRRQWNSLPGRKTWLLEDCCQWYLMNPDFGPVLEEVSALWRNEASNLPADSEEQLSLLRWASNFDRSAWKETTTPDGKKGWELNRPTELRDIDAEKKQSRRKILMSAPLQCNEVLTKRPQLPENQFDSLWNTLSNWDQFETDSQDEDEREFSSSFLDHRHARAGLLAVILCLGNSWLQKHPNEHSLIKDEVRKLLNDPPKVFSFGPDDLHDDGEGFLARCAVRCLCEDPKNKEWRESVAKFALAYRYRTVQVLFDEVYHARPMLGSVVLELEAFILSYAVVRKNAYSFRYHDPNIQLLNDWADNWVPAFAAGTGPTWSASWANIESLTNFPTEDDAASSGRRRRQHIRRAYGLDVSLLIAAFTNLPPLASAIDNTEREHWLNITKQMLAVLLRTIPSSQKGDDEEWVFQGWKTDEQIFDCVANRLSECSHQEQKTLWQPILDLPPVAHHHITQFLSSVLLKFVGVEPPKIQELLPIWKEIIEYLFSKPEWLRDSHNCDEVWKEIFLYGTPFTCIGDKDFIPFVEGLRPLFKQHVTTCLDDAYDQSAFAGFLTTSAGDILLVDAFAWLLPSWERASDWFWKRVAERSNFPNLLDHAWRDHFTAIKKSPDALKAFKMLTMKLAVEQIPSALEVQRLIGSD